MSNYDLDDKDVEAILSAYRRMMEHGLEEHERPSHESMDRRTFDHLAEIPVEYGPRRHYVDAMEVAGARHPHITNLRYPQEPLPPDPDTVTEPYPYRDHIHTIEAAIDRYPWRDGHEGRNWRRRLDLVAAWERGRGNPYTAPTGGRHRPRSESFGPSSARNSKKVRFDEPPGSGSGLRKKSLLKRK